MFPPLGDKVRGYAPHKGRQTLPAHDPRGEAPPPKAVAGARTKARDLRSQVINLLILLDIRDSISSPHTRPMIQNPLQFGLIPEVMAKHYCRAKYYRSPTGEMVLASVQQMSRPIFGEYGLEEITAKEKPSLSFTAMPTPEEAAANFMRSQRRAKIAAFDLIMCNHDLDTFATFTYDPQQIGDRTSYEECYEVLRVWLSNRVQRKGLKYVICPERHKKGGIHFHMIANSEALALDRARYANSGRLMYHNGNPLFNISDWRCGFTTAEKIRAGAGDRVAVSKYIFKYMGKQSAQRIGGRFFLHGGEMSLPIYDYADTPSALADLATAKTIHACEDIGGFEGLWFREWSFL